MILLDTHVLIYLLFDESRYRMVIETPAAPSRG